MGKFEAGWGLPALAKRWHFFARDGIVTLCGRWMYTGPRFDEEVVNSYSRAKCVECERLRVKGGKRVTGEA